MPVSDVRWFGSTPYTCLVVSALRERGFEIATTGDHEARLVMAMSGSVGTRAWRFAVRKQVPMVQYIWDLPPWWLGSGHPDPVVSVGGRLLRIPRVGRRYQAKRGYLARLYYVARRSAAVWAPSTSSRDSIVTRFGIDCRLVPYCYDSSTFHPGEAGAPITGRDPTSLVSVSRLVDHKRHAAVIRVAARFSPPRSVTLVGQGPEAAPLRRLAERLGVGLRLVADLTPDQLVAVYRSAGVVVCPSRFEGMGLTPIEAAAVGARVVASDIPAHREFLGNRVEFFEPDDDDALRLAIMRADERTPLPGPFYEITIEAAADRFHQALSALLERGSGGP